MKTDLEKGRTRTHIGLENIACNVSVVTEGNRTGHKSAVLKSLD
jgi:hypothetical protein